LSTNDLAIFVDVLLEIDLSPGHIRQSNLNCDAFVDGSDIQAFVSAWLMP